MTPTLDTALLMCGSPEWGRATSSTVGADLGRTSDSRVDAWCEVILPRNKVKGQITECYFYWTLSIHIFTSKNIGEQQKSTKT